MSGFLLAGRPEEPMAYLYYPGYSHKEDLRAGLQQRAAQTAGQASVGWWSSYGGRCLLTEYTSKPPTGKSKEELDALLFDRAARRNRTDPYEKKKYRGSGIKEVQAWWNMSRLDGTL